MCCARLAGNAGPKNRHLGTIAQLCRAISSPLRYISTIGKKTVTRQCLPNMSSQYGEFQPTSGWDLLASLRHPCKFQLVSRLGSITAQHSSSGRQPSFTVLNRGRHLYSAGRLSRWALAHIYSFIILHLFICHNKITCNCCFLRYQCLYAPFLKCQFCRGLVNACRLTEYAPKCKHY